MAAERTVETARVGRPPLTAQDRARLRTEIARAAVRLFTSKGVAATSAEQIATEAGVSVRTLWRHVPDGGKEHCVRPLLSAGIDGMARALADTRADTGPGGLATLVRIRDENGNAERDVRTMLALVRLTRTEPGIRAVWLAAHRDAEPVFARSLAARTGRDPGELAVRVEAALLNAALRVAVEHTAEHTEPEDAGAVAALSEAVRLALTTATRPDPRRSAVD
ncbi:TetR/AcrR family transcriptional regulator [Saccharomonospora piscinae]|uniref:TetR/AcrR family transcriptional regulator n=1 Tax=Saccharomonospora piscinae TaxID=687388 RepID=UPI0004668D8E|nr:TetR/AcrR family transcriptional regulator [Saccharomonospora piscinae]